MLEEIAALDSMLKEKEAKLEALLTDQKDLVLRMSRLEEALEELFKVLEVEA